MIKNVIDEYNKKFNPSYDDNFLGHLKNIKNKLENPKFMLSKELIQTMDKNITNYLQPIQVGVIGQFSSGKSSLLNLLFKKNLLATGARPVSVVATYIKYGEKDVVLGEYEEGLKIINSKNLNDQNENIDGLKNIHIYTDNEILKNITLIDTPGLNANENDEEFSKNLINSFDALIWLSLAESAGKLSEEKAIKSFKKNIPSICLVNQKDKLNKQEQEKLQNYLNKVFSKYFSKIELISCKLAVENNNDSNIEAFYNFLKDLNKTEIKEKIIKENLENIKYQLNYINLKIYDALNTLNARIDEYNDIIKKINNKEIFDDFNEKILNALKTIAKNITQEFLNNFKEKNANYFTNKKTLLHKDCYEKNEYKYKTIIPDDTFLNIFYNKDIINKEFLRIKKELNDLFLNIKDNFKQPLNNFINNLNLLKTKELGKNYLTIVKSEYYGICDDFYKALDELIINDYQKAFFQYELKLNLLYEKINTKALNNYENATKLSLSFFYEKINASREFYELDNTKFKLYLPSENEIYNRLLTDCSFYEFEELLINKKQMNKHFNDYLTELSLICEKQKEAINIRLNKLKNIENSLLEILKIEN
ncbi:dynamin family protein [Campylobacter sp. MG1]|uniref:dynamin family protein n=1 Tax=Campylobacter sp. MG1 TaxID=2976332 RepID=UPI00226C6E6E|nr:dynamin family protein [Campylobacter sp. MG1]